MQYFKGDSDETKIVASGQSTFDSTSFQLSEFLADAYNCQAFGDIIYTSGRSPLSNAILQSIYRESFNDIFTAFVSSGSFESYLSVFRKIFGIDVSVTFTVPDPGQLNIDIVSTGLEISDFVARSIVDDAYVFDKMLTQAGDNIVFQGIKGFQSQYELEQMLFEMVPDGIYTEITLTVG